MGDRDSKDVEKVDQNDVAFSWKIKPLSGRRAYHEETKIQG